MGPDVPQVAGGLLHHVKFYQGDASNGWVNAHWSIHWYICLHISAPVKVVQNTFQRPVDEGASPIIWGRCASLMRVPGTSCRFQYLGGISEEPDVQSSP